MGTSIRRLVYRKLDFEVVIRINLLFLFASFSVLVPLVLESSGQGLVLVLLAAGLQRLRRRLHLVSRQKSGIQKTGVKTCYHQKSIYVLTFLPYAYVSIA